jgi:hypothetical protein
VVAFVEVLSISEQVLIGHFEPFIYEVSILELDIEQSDSCQSPEYYVFKMTFLIDIRKLFIQERLKKRKEPSLHLYIVRSFNFTFRYIDDVLSLNNSTFGDFVDYTYRIELEIKDTTYTARFASYIDLHQDIDNEGWLRTKLYDKRDELNFPIVNFPFICSNIPATPAYGVYISQLIRACGSCHDIKVSLIGGCC